MGIVPTKKFTQDRIAELQTKNTSRYGVRYDLPLLPRDRPSNPPVRYSQWQVQPAGECEYHLPDQAGDAVEVAMSLASRGYPRPKECRGCDSFIIKPQTGDYPLICENADDFCTAWDLHIEWVSGILEGEACFKAKYKGIS